MIFYRIICFIRRDHHYHKEIMIDENTTKNYCKCGKSIGFDWSDLGGYKKAMNSLSNLERENRWDTPSGGSD